MKPLRFSLFDPAADGGNPDAGAGGGAAAAAPAWHETLVTKGADGVESLADFNTWKDKAPAPLVKMITDNMTAARAKTEGLLKVPGAEATPEEVAAYHKALGVPDTPDGYEIKPPEKMPDGVAFDEAQATAFKSVAKEIGLTPAQVAKLSAWQIEQVGAGAAKSRESIAAVIAAEKVELEQAFGDKLDVAVANASKLAAQKWVPEEFRKYINDGALDPKSGNFGGVPFLKFMDAVARATGEDAGAGGVRGGSNAGNTPAYWVGVMKDKTHPDNIKLAQQEPDTVKRYNDAYKASA